MEGSQEPLKLYRHWPKASWEDTFEGDDLPAQVGWRERLAGMARLSLIPMSPDDFEVRYWRRDSWGAISGAVFARYGGRYRCYALPLVDSYYVGPVTPLPEPFLGWEAFWQQLQTAGLLTMEDPNPGGIGGVEELDGVSFLVEANIGGGHRALSFKYGSKPCPLQAQMKEIVRLLDSLLSEGVMLYQSGRLSINREQLINPAKVKEAFYNSQSNEPSALRSIGGLG